MKHNTYNYEGGQPFKVEAPFIPTGDQPGAIASLTEGIERGEWAQVLLGATGTGKTFTMAKVIEAVQKPTLIIAHNKTLAAQLASEFKSFFPNNAVEYFGIELYRPITRLLLSNWNEMTERINNYTPEEWKMAESIQTSTPSLDRFSIAMLIEVLEGEDTLSQSENAGRRLSDEELRAIRNHQDEQ